MRQQHEIEKKFEEWKKAGCGDQKLNPVQEQEV